MKNAVSEEPPPGTLYELLEAVTYASHHDDVVVTFEDGRVHVARSSEPLAHAGK